MVQLDVGLHDQAELFYNFDTLYGWCYGAAPPFFLATDALVGSRQIKNLSFHRESYLKIHHRILARLKDGSCGSRDVVIITAKPELVYIFDTLCGWCYGATPALSRARDAFGDALGITLLHGGLFTGNNAHSMPDMRPIALEHDKRIHELTGQPFSDAYIKNIVMNDDVVHDSTPTALAHHVVKQLAPEWLLDFLRAAQHARFVEGQDLTSWSAYVPIVKPFGISVKQFFDGFYNDDRIRTAMHEEFRLARDLMEQVVAEGFPAIVLKHDGAATLIPHGQFLVSPGKIVSRVKDILSRK
ncbi:MAG TPA: hypothetical protein VKM55_11975 [Candidatus Lokiarchaeia archaeon]|nr:hypothetical protein [Candidatus Lokiarchaeia archaeon]